MAAFNSTVISKNQQYRFSCRHLEKKILMENIILGCWTSREIPPSL